MGWKQRVVPCRITYGSAMGACRKRGQWQEALGIVQEMSQEQVKLDVTICNAAVEVCEKGEQWQSAPGIMSQLWSPQIKPHAGSPDCVDMDADCTHGLYQQVESKK